MWTYPTYASNRCILSFRKGKDCFEYIGNRRFRVLVSCHVDRYSQAETKSAKGAIVSEIIQMVRNAPGGGYFARHDDEGNWMECGDDLAREKVGGLLRGSLHTQYKSAVPSKSKKRSSLRQDVDDDEEGNNTSRRSFHNSASTATPASTTTTSTTNAYPWNDSNDYDYDDDDILIASVNSTAIHHNHHHHQQLQQLQQQQDQQQQQQQHLQSSIMSLELSASSMCVEDLETSFSSLTFHSSNSSCNNCIAAT